MEVTVPRWPLQCEGRNFYGQKLDNLEHAGDAGAGPRRYRAGGARLPAGVRQRGLQSGQQSWLVLFLMGGSVRDSEAEARYWIQKALQRSRHPTHSPEYRPAAVRKRRFCRGACRASGGAPGRPKPPFCSIISVCAIFGLGGQSCGCGLLPRGRRSECCRPAPRAVRGGPSPPCLCVLRAGRGTDRCAAPLRAGAERHGALGLCSFMRSV